MGRNGEDKSSVVGFEYEDEKWQRDYREALADLDEEFYPYKKRGNTVSGAFTTLFYPGLRKAFLGY